jgi:DNA-binding FrmR family transcriptional regulator
MNNLLKAHDTMTHPSHNEQIVFLKRIEGQIRGVQKMIEERRYCVDILTQLHSIIGAVLRVESKILKRHLETCVTGVLKGSSEAERDRKIEEVIDLITKFRKTT